MTNDRLKLMIQYAIMIALTIKMLISIPTPELKASSFRRYVHLAAFLLVGKAPGNSLIGRYLTWLYRLASSLLFRRLSGWYVDTNFAKTLLWPWYLPLPLLWSIIFAMAGLQPLATQQPRQAGVGIAEPVSWDRLCLNQAFENAPQH